MRKTIFISDLHLQESTPEINEIFFNFCRNLQEVDAVYILGDLFEAWIGDDDVSDFNLQVFNAIKSMSESGVKVYFVQGNRDFLIGKKFAEKTHCKLLSDETIIDLYGEPALIMHGDTLCTVDPHYLKFRKFARNPIIKNTYLCLPLTLRRTIASKLRMKSKNHTQQSTSAMMDVSLEEVKNILSKQNVKLLIHGHTHKPCIHHSSQYTRIVLAAWHSGGNMLICQEDRKKELIDFNLDGVSKKYQ